MKRKIGITTTIPSEVIFAAGAVPVDLNNLFITHKNPAALIKLAEEDGISRNTCSWIKGMYGALKINVDINEVVVVTRGDCSNAVALAEVLKHKKYKVISFAYPEDKDGDALTVELNKFMKYFSVTRRTVDNQKKILDKIRAKVETLDELTWRENKITGFENHLYLISTSDFNSDPNMFTKKIDRFLAEVKSRQPFKEEVRLGYIGVPPIVLDLHNYLETIGARVVYNEIQYQFAMTELTDDLVEQYLMYTYPYDVFGRIVEIKAEIEKRKVDGIIHYVQSFCHHQIEDIILQKELAVPILTVEADRPGSLDLRNMMRLEAFVNVLKQ